VVCLGPGSYTGIRTGLASSNGLALALGIPVFGISGLIARLRPYLKKQDSGGLLLSYQLASKAEYYWSLLRGETKADNSWPLQVLRPLTFSKIELFERDVQTCLHEQDLDSSTLIRARVDPEHIALTESPAASLCWAQSYITCAEPEYQLSDARTSLQPLYGKGANAKTLLERGIKKH